MPKTLPAVLLAALVAVPGLALADDASDIAAVITDQLADFNARDVPGAWEHASPMIQGMFGTSENFGRMVETGYPMVWTNSGARFMALTEGAEPHQKVMVKDAEGRAWILDYAMVQVEGEWRINGVMVLPAPDLSA